MNELESATQPLAAEVIASLRREPFIERHWLAEKIEQHMAEDQCRFVLVTGGPGLGKSALVAWLTSRHELAPRYFIRLDSLAPYSSGDAAELLIAIGTQLSLLCPAIAQTDALTVNVDQDTAVIAEGGTAIGAKITNLVANPFHKTTIMIQQHVGRVEGSQVGVEIGRLVDDPRLMDVEQLQRLALFDPAARLERLDGAATIVVLIDALDELRYRPAIRTGWTIVDWLECCPRLPPNVRIVATSRPDDLTAVFCAKQASTLRQVPIDPSDVHARSDVAEYASRIAADLRVAKAFRLRGRSAVGAAQNVATAAAGNFLFVVAWARAVHSAIDRASGDELDSLSDPAITPMDLDMLYATFIRLLRRTIERSRSEPGWYRLHWPLLSILAVARGPLTSRQLREFAGLTFDDGVVAKGLRQISQFTSDGQRGHFLFHSSFAEYLTVQRDRSDPDCYVDPTVEHRRIADRILDRYQGTWGTCEDDYALANVAVHLVHAVQGAEAEWSEYAQKITNLLADPEFVDAKAGRIGGSAVIGDFINCHAALSRSEADSAAVSRALAYHAVRHEAHSGVVNSDALHDSLAYRTPTSDLYSAVLNHATDDSFVAAVVPGLTARLPVISAFRHCLLTWYRRLGETEHAQRILAEIEQMADITGRTRAKLLYDKAYLDFLYGRVEDAIATMRLSEQASREAGDEAGYWISHTVGAQISFFADRISVDTFREIVNGAARFFATASGPHAARWRMNPQHYLFDIAFATEDVARAEVLVRGLREDDWTRLNYPGLWLIWDARIALLRGNWEAACQAYEELLGPDTIASGGPFQGELVARHLLEYGRALAGSGRLDAAHQIWQHALAVPEGTAAWPWRAEIRRRLTEAGLV